MTTTNKPNTFLADWHRAADAENRPKSGGFRRRKPITLAEREANDDRIAKIRAGLRY